LVGSDLRADRSSKVPPVAKRCRLGDATSPTSLTR